VPVPASTTSFREILIRCLAMAAVAGLVATGATVLRTDALRAAPVEAFLLAGPVMGVFAGLGAALAIALALAAGGARAAGIDPRRFASARFLWTLGLGLLAYTLFNQSVRVWDGLEPWKDPGRLAIAGPGLLLVARALFARPRPSARASHLAEGGLAALLLPAGVGLLLYTSRDLPEPAERRPGDVLALAPRFEPEPEAVLADARARSRPRIVVLGIDGADWDDIDRGIATDRLPNFQRLREEGLTAPLETLHPTYSPRIWTSMFTGVPPEEHGVTDFYLTQLPRLGIESFRFPRGFSTARDLLDALGELKRVPATSSLRRRKAVWNLADEAGLRTAVLGLWATWPPEPLEHGLVVSDHASTARRQEWTDRAKTQQRDLGTTTHPPQLAERLAPYQRPPDSVTREELSFFLPVDDALWTEFQGIRRFSKGVPLSAFRSTFLNDAFYLDAALHLWRTDEPDLLLVYARAVDELSHFFYEAGAPEAPELGWSPAEIARYGDVVDRIYAWTDRRLGAFLDLADRDPDTLVVVVSDHGWEKEPDGSYDHNDAPPGILALYGAGVCRADCPPLPTPHVYDVAPLVLSRLGLPLSEELPGRTLRQAFVGSGSGPARPLRVARYGPSLGDGRAVSSEIDGSLNEMLEALGYVR